MNIKIEELKAELSKIEGRLDRRFEAQIRSDVRAKNRAKAVDIDEHSIRAIRAEMVELRLN
tara:strand:+ start:226 stop:408 length:183 start_codon:yes stop_codon:yes gene_type:complete